MSRPVTIAAIQLPCWTEGEAPAARKAFNLAQIAHWLDAAGRSGADIACLGETAPTHHVGAPPDDPAIVEDACTGPSATLAARLARAHAMAVVLPVAARHAGRLQNVALVIDRQGHIVGHYAKVHPTRGELAQGIVRGDDFPVFDLDQPRIAHAFSENGEVVFRDAMLADRQPGVYGAITDRSSA